jgi:hypothetical protein
MAHTEPLPPAPPAPPADLETDPRFPSGPWTGFFMQKQIPGRHLMELNLIFRQGGMSGEGRDWVGPFVIKGRYEIGDGQCHWTKRYLGKHDVFYKGFNEGKGIWGTWEIPTDGPSSRGGFHIWPEGQADPTSPHLTEAADVPLTITSEVVEEVEEKVLVPISR